MQNKSNGSHTVTIETPTDAAPTSTGNGVRLPLMVNVEAEDFVILSVEASKFGVPIDEFVGTLIQVGLDKWRATDRALA